MPRRSREASPTNENQTVLVEGAVRSPWRRALVAAKATAPIGLTTINPQECVDRKTESPCLH
jgi:hypothetical protein